MKRASKICCTTQRLVGGKYHAPTCENVTGMPVRTWFVVRAATVKRLRSRQCPADGFSTFAEAKAELVAALEHDIACLKDALREARRLKAVAV